MSNCHTAELVLTASSYRYAESFAKLPFSSREYFEFLFTLCSVERLHPTISGYWAIPAADCVSLLLAGLVTSADTGNEDLVIETRAALADICQGSHESLHRICTALVDNLKCHQGVDRVVVPTLEVVAFLFHVGLLHHRADLDLKQLCLLVQKAAYKTGNVRKLEACIRVYGGIAAIDHPPPLTPTAIATPARQTDYSGVMVELSVELRQKRQAGIAEAKRRLGGLMLHPWPRIRSLAVDELWSLVSAAPDDGPEKAQQEQKLLGVDWGRADKTHIKRMVVELGFEV